MQWWILEITPASCQYRGEITIKINGYTAYRGRQLIPCAARNNYVESRALALTYQRLGISMNFVIKTGGKQYHVSEGDKLEIETLDAAPGDKVEFPEVLLLRDGDSVEVGTPLIEGAKVTATVLAHGRGKKIRIIKFKRRKHYRRAVVRW